VGSWLREKTMPAPDKVLIITYYWPPSGGPGVQRWLRFSRYFSQSGVLPVILTVDPAKASYAVKDESLLHEVPEALEVHRTKTFEPYNIYLKLSGKKEIPYSGFVNESKPTFMQKVFRFMRGNLFIPDSRKGWNKRAYRKAAELITSQGIKTVITTSPPHSSQLIGLKLKQRFDIQWIADIRDPWTDIYYYKEMLHTRWAARKDANYERRVLEMADNVVVVSDAIRRQFLAKSAKIDPQKVVVIPNGYEEEDFSAINEINRPEGSLMIAYTGTLAAQYTSGGFFEAFRQCEDVVLEIAGAVADKLIPDDLLSGIKMHGYLPHNESVSLICKADVLLLVIPDVPGNEGILTGKLFEYLATGKPILGVGPVEGDAARILNETGNGKMFGYSDANGMLAFLNAVRSGEFKASGAPSRYSRRALANDFIKLIPQRHGH
jgi:glycosyltransferase involved in cell wall biosynthesis